VHGHKAAYSLPIIGQCETQIADDRRKINARYTPGYPIDEIDNQSHSISIDSNRYQLID